MEKLRELSYLCIKGIVLIILWGVQALLFVVAYMCFMCVTSHFFIFFPVGIIFVFGGIALLPQVVDLSKEVIKTNIEDW